MGLKSIIFYVAFSILSFSAANGQLAGVQTTAGFVREEVSLVTDRTLYLSGENIWFSACCTIDGLSDGRQLSNVLYIELYHHQQAVVKKKFQIVDGIIEGMLTIPGEIPSANYYLRAYTQYQRNFAPETFFTTLLTIINPEIPIQKPKTRPLKLVTIIPEGGQLIPGKPAKIALKINTGLVGSIEKSLLTDQYNDTLNLFQIAANGLALIEFTPLDSLEYYLKFLLKTGDTVTEALPKKRGNGLLISGNPENSEVILYATEAYLKTNNPGHQLLVVPVNGAEKIEFPVYLDKSTQHIKVDFNKLDKGFCVLELRNSRGALVAHSTLFLSENPIKINLKPVKEVFGIREKVQLSLSVEPNDRIPTRGLRVSVVKKGTTLNTGKNLPLSVIENPLLLPALADEMKLTDPGIANQIKAVMILHQDVLGTQQAEWQVSGTNGSETKWLPETRDVSLSGMVRNTKTRQALSGVWLFASVLGRDAQFHAYKTREDGSFVFSLNKLNNTHNLALAMDSIDGVETEFMIYNDFSDQWPVAKDIPLNIDSAQRSLLENMFVNHQLAGIFRPKEQVFEQTGDLLPFPFSDLQASIKLKDFVAMPTLTEVINELVPYLHVKKRNGKFILAVLDDKRNNIYKHPLVLVDNLPVFNVKDILSINPAKVEGIDVIAKVYHFGELPIQGIVMFHTKTDNFGGIRLPSSSVFLEYQTITPSAAVQFPVYNPQNETPAHSPDFKNLLYWNPSVPFSGNDTTINFYTADEKTDYEIVVRGKAGDGKAVFGKAEIRVE